MPLTVGGTSGESNIANLWKDHFSAIANSVGPVGSMIDCFLEDALGVLFCPFWSTVLPFGARLPIHTLDYWTV